MAVMSVEECILAHDENRAFGLEHPWRSLARNLAAWRKTLEEEALGYVVRTSERRLHAEFGYGNWRCMCRFAIFQSGKWRCIDDAAESGHNLATHLRETIHCISSDFPAAVGEAFARSGCPDVVFSTDDIGAAYRKVGNREPRYTIFVIWNPVDGRHEFFKVPMRKIIDNLVELKRAIKYCT